MKGKSNPRLIYRVLASVLLVGGVIALALFSAPASGVVFAQQPTGSIPTVTGTLEGPKIIVYADRDIIGVYDGPSSYLYSQVGILLAGEEAPALGYSADQEWIKIVYLGVPSGTGWVYAPLVAVTDGSSLPLLLSPPTATPRTTPTIDPTRAALYGLQLTPENLPTFTQAPPIEVLEFESVAETRRGLPMGLVILVLALFGVLGAVISFLRVR
jgi:hypothetical protein